MKKILFLIFWIMSHSIIADDTSKQFITANSLKAVCTINIMQEKLLHANSALPIESRVDEVGSRLQKLYEQCVTIINDPDSNLQQPDLTESNWINKNLREIYILQHDNEPKKCAQAALECLNQITENSNTEQKNATIQLFFKNAESCAYQYALKISRPYLKAQIEQWNNDESKRIYDAMIWKLLLKHNPKKQSDFDQDLINIYNQPPNPMMIDLETFSQKITKILTKINGDAQAQTCLQDILDFQEAFYATDNNEEREHFITSFAIQYLQCKNK